LQGFCQFSSHSSSSSSSSSPSRPNNSGVEEKEEEEEEEDDDDDDDDDDDVWVKILCHFFNVSDEVVESCAERCSCTQMARTHPCSLEADTCGSRCHLGIPQPLTRLPWNLPVLLISRET
jgi:hypothetical protein